MSQICTEEDVSFGVGDVVAGKYELLRLVGRGGMGLVFEAQHLGFGQSVAIKFLLPKYAANEKVRLRFLQEARALCRLRGENVARVLDTDELPEGSPYIVMEFLHGRSIAAHLARRGPLDIEEAVDIVLQAAVGVAEAHAIGIIHRDLKPANLFLTVGSDRLPLVKVLDFGISKVLDEEDECGARFDSVLGSPQYMSPEQMRSPNRVDARTDIWSLGVILFELLAGRLPFPGRTLLVLFTESLAPPDLAAIRPEVSPKLASVVARCLARQRPERFDSVAMLARALLPFGSSRSAAWVERIERIIGGSSDGSLTAPLSDGLASAGKTSSSAMARRGLLGTTMRDRVPGLALLLTLGIGLVGTGVRHLSAGSTTVGSQPTLGSSVPAQELALPSSAASTAVVTTDSLRSARTDANDSPDLNASSAPPGPTTTSRTTSPEGSRRVLRQDATRPPRQLVPQSSVSSSEVDGATQVAPVTPTARSNPSGSDPLQLDSRH